MTTVQDLMKLADAHADAASKYQLESIYGKSKSYTLEKDAERDEARDALQSALEAQAAEIERLNLYIKHIGNDALRKENHALQSKLDAMQSVEPFCMHWEDRWGCNHYADKKEQHPSNAIPLYTHPKVFK